MSLLHTIKQNPSNSAVLTDIDGTISPIVQNPEDAYVESEIRQLMSNLRNKYHVAGVVTSRSLLMAKEIIGINGIVYTCNSGLEILHKDGSYWIADGVSEKKIKTFLEDARERLPFEGIYLENKVLTASVHYRHCIKRKNEIKRALEEIIPHYKLKIKPGNNVFEILPDVEVNKGTAVKKLIEEYEIKYIVFFGDDYSDLAVSNLKLPNGYFIAVKHKETPKDVIEKADLVVEGVKGVREKFIYLLN